MGLVYWALTYKFFLCLVVANAAGVTAMFDAAIIIASVMMLVTAVTLVLFLFLL